MAFDEQGQAESVERKVVICGRCYDLPDRGSRLRQDLVFDPNILEFATGIQEDDPFAGHRAPDDARLHQRRRLAAVYLVLAR